jgi:PleD family two-component response regulator
MKPVVVLIEPLIEDAERIAEALAEAGFYPAVAFDAARGLGLIKLVAPELVVVNQSLPDRSGFRLVQDMIRDPEIAKIPIVMVGRTGDPGTVAWAKRAGAVEYLSKDLEDLAGRLSELAERYLPENPAEAIPRLDDSLLDRIRRIVMDVSEDPYLNDAGKTAVAVAEIAALTGMKPARGSVIDWRGQIVEADHEWLEAPDGTLIDPAVQRMWPHIKGWPGYDDVAVIANRMPLHKQYVARN